MRPERHHGFTLLELLIVMAIIALLTGLLMPALGVAKKQARQIACMNNERQISSTIHMYASDYDDYLPSMNESYPWAYGGNPSVAVPTGKLAPYLNAKKYYYPQCTLCPSDPREVTQMGFCSYGLNVDIVGIDQYLDIHRNGARKLSASSTPNVLLMDGSGDGGYNDRLNCHRFYGDYQYISKAQNYHQGGGNYLFVDGHVAWYQIGGVPEANKYFAWWR